MTSRYDTGDTTNGDLPPEPMVASAHRANPGQTEVDRPRNLSRDHNELRLMLDPTMHAPQLARRAMSEWQSTIELDAALSADVIAVVSELVTNAVLHAHSPSEVIATIDDDDVLRVEVHDLGTEPPVLRSSDGANGGCGLRLVAGLADRWGWRPTTTGKYVWTETDCGSHPAGRQSP